MFQSIVVIAVSTTATVTATACPQVQPYRARQVIHDLPLFREQKCLQHVETTMKAKVLTQSCEACSGFLTSKSSIDHTTTVGISSDERALVCCTMCTIKVFFGSTTSTDDAKC